MNYTSIGNGIYVRTGSRKTRRTAPVTRPKCGDTTIYRLRDGKMVKVGEPRLPLNANFVIVCEYGDWSGFRTLAECEKQFAALETAGRPNGYYEVVER